MSLSTHVLDIATGLPAVGVDVAALRAHGDGWEPVASGTTDADGRIGDLAGPEPRLGVHRLVFDLAAWRRRNGTAGFHPEVVLTFVVEDESAHLHVPLLLGPYGYTTYRGS